MGLDCLLRARCPSSRGVEVHCMVFTGKLLHEDSADATCLERSARVMHQTFAHARGAASPEQGDSSVARFQPIANGLHDKAAVRRARGRMYTYL